MRDDPMIIVGMFARISGWLKPSAFDVHARESVRIVIEIRFRAAKHKASAIIGRSIPIGKVRREQCNRSMTHALSNIELYSRTSRFKSTGLYAQNTRDRSTSHVCIDFGMAPLSRAKSSVITLRRLLYYCHNHHIALPPALFSISINVEVAIEEAKEYQILTCQFFIDIYVLKYIFILYAMRLIKNAIPASIFSRIRGKKFIWRKVSIVSRI